MNTKIILILNTGLLTHEKKRYKKSWNMQKICEQSGDKKGCTYVEKEFRLSDKMCIS